MKLRLLFTGIITLCFMWGCKNNPEPSTGVMYVHIPHDPSQMHPVNTMSSAQQYIYTLTQKSLYKIDMRTMDLMPDLIENLPELLDDGITYEFYLKDGIRWDDGAPLTCEDVAFTIKMNLSPLSRNAAFRAIYGSVIDSVWCDPDNPLHFKVVMLSTGLSNNYVLGDMPMLQKKYWDPENLTYELSFADTHSPDFVASEKLAGWFDQFNSEENGHKPEKLVGLGPYKITEWEDDVQIVCERKKNWWGASDTSVYNQAYTPRIIFRIIENEQAAVEAFKRNELDVSHAIGTESLIGLRKSADFNKKYHSGFVDQLSYMYIALNMKPDGIKHEPVFEERAVRKAMAHAINVEELIEVFLHGQGKRQMSMISPSKSYCNRDLEPIPYDPEKAKTILEANGWTDTDGDNIRDKVVNGHKTKLEFKLNIFAEIQSYKDMALMIKNSMDAVGFNVNINVLEFNDLYARAITHDFDAMIGSWEGDASIDNPYQLWSTEAWSSGGYNFTGFGNTYSDSLIAACNATVDKKEYDQLIKKIQELIYIEQPYIFLYQPKKKMIISKAFHNTDMYVEKAGIILNNLKPVD